MSDEIEMPNEALERHEHLHEHEAHGGGHGGKITLLILILAMAAAIGGKISAENEIHYLTYEIERSDTWGQYQGKADRAAMAEDFAKLAALMPNAADPAVQQAIAGFHADAARLESDPDHEGKQQLAAKAKQLEQQRDDTARRMEGFSMVVVLLALSIGLASASMLSKQTLPRVVLAAVSAVTGLGAIVYGMLVATALL